VVAVMFNLLTGAGEYNPDCLTPSGLEVHDMYVEDYVRQTVLFLGNKDQKTE
jgi:hypothetical protein